MAQPHHGRVFPVDVEHGGLCGLLIGQFVVVAGLAYWLLGLMWPAPGFNTVALVGAVLLAGVVSAGLERALKQRWPSGRTLHVSADGVQLRQGASALLHVAASAPADILRWHFVVEKRARVPKGWVVAAHAVVQAAGDDDEQLLPVYGFIPPQAFERLGGAAVFPALQKLGPDRDPSKLAGAQRRLRRAEEARWRSGAELTATDFAAYIDEVQHQCPQWHI